MGQKRRILDFHIGWQMPTKLIMCVDIAIIFVSSFLNGIDPSPVKPASHLQWVCSKLRCPRSFGCPVCPQHLPPEVAHSFGARRIQITEMFRTPPVTQDNQIYIYIKYIGKRASNSGVWSINCYSFWVTRLFVKSHLEEPSDFSSRNTETGTLWDGS